MTNENGDDGVEAGIREWRKTKAQAEEAIDKARVAEQDATFVRGQLEVLQQQKHADDVKIRTLEAHVAEMELYTNAMVDAILSIVERRKAGIFRRAGSIRDGGARIREAQNGSDAESDGRPSESRSADNVSIPNRGGVGSDVSVRPDEVGRSDDPPDDGEPIPAFLRPADGPAEQLERDIANMHRRRKRD